MIAVSVAGALLLASVHVPARAVDVSYTGSIAPRQPLEAAPSPPPAHLVVLGFAGDVGFSGDGDVPSSAGAVKHGSVIPWERFTAGIAPLLGADANFANLETVIARHHDLPAIEKSFNFMGSPEGLRHVISAGLTVLTVANNHAGDFGALGIVETLAQLAAAKSFGLKAFAGLGIGADRYQPDVFQLAGHRIGIAAIGIGINHGGADGPGQPLYASPQDFERIVAALARTGADIRVLSVHFGKELISLPSERDKRRLRSAVDSGRAAIVFGHHSHVPSGLEYRNGGLILYGLGNFMHSGTQDMSRYGACRDFGLYAKAYVWMAPGEAPVIRAVELFPIRGMHMAPEPLAPVEAARRIAIVNAMSAAVAGDGTASVHLEMTSRASGLACFGKQTGYGDELSARCHAAAGPLQAARLVENSLPPSCGFDAPPRPAVEAAAVPTTTPPIPKLSPRKPRKALAAEKSRAKSIFGLKFFD